MTIKSIRWAIVSFLTVQGLALFLNMASGNDWGTPAFGLAQGVGMLIWIMLYGFWRNDRSSERY